MTGVGIIGPRFVGSAYFQEHYARPISHATHKNTVFHLFGPCNFSQLALAHLASEHPHNRVVMHVSSEPLVVWDAVVQHYPSEQAAYESWLALSTVVIEAWPVLTRLDGAFDLRRATTANAAARHYVAPGGAELCRMAIDNASIELSEETLDAIGDLIDNAIVRHNKLYRRRRLPPRHLAPEAAVAPADSDAPFAARGERHRAPEVAVPPADSDAPFAARGEEVDSPYVSSDASDAVARATASDATAAALEAASAAFSKVSKLASAVTNLTSAVAAASSHASSGAPDEAATAFSNAAKLAREVASDATAAASTAFSKVAKLASAVADLTSTVAADDSSHVSSDASGEATPATAFSNAVAADKTPAAAAADEIESIDSSAQSKDSLTDFVVGDLASEPVSRSSESSFDGKSGKRLRHLEAGSSTSDDESDGSGGGSGGSEEEDAAGDTSTSDDTPLRAGKRAVQSESIAASVKRRCRDVDSTANSTSVPWVGTDYVVRWLPRAEMENLSEASTRVPGRKRTGRTEMMLADFELMLNRARSQWPSTVFFRQVIAPMHAMFKTIGRHTRASFADELFLLASLGRIGVFDDNTRHPPLAKCSVCDKSERVAAVGSIAFYGKGLPAELMARYMPTANAGLFSYSPLDEIESDRLRPCGSVCARRLRAYVAVFDALNAAQAAEPDRRKAWLHTVLLRYAAAQEATDQTWPTDADD